jgi:hypothetical protein
MVSRMVYVPPDQPSVRVVRTSPYKGGTRTWGNRFFLTGGNFTSGQFAAIAAWMRLHMKQFLLTTSSITEVVGYDIGSDVPVYTDSTVTAGIYAASTLPVMPLEVAALARFSTTQRSTKNHPIYLYKYFHAAQNDGGADAEKLRAGMKSTIEGEMANLVAGFSDGSGTRILCDSRGAVAQGYVVKAELTHRDFPNL